ncbi:MAG: hypothetical protein M3Z04_25285 [Chloroflexota bacterium]|nr:hypothetical protein [Chloroflexota bacterium]
MNPHPLITYEVLTTPALPPYKGPLYEYWLHGGGVALRAERDGLRACIPVAAAPVRGLPVLTSTVQLGCPRVPAALTQWLFDRAYAARDPAGDSIEILFHLRWAGLRWRVDIPPQIGSAGSVYPTESGPGSSYAGALIEVHSHHGMAAFWSDTDDADEQGFRLYAVLGDIFQRPTLRVRVGIYGQFYELPAGTIFDLPVGVHTHATADPIHQEGATQP